MVRAAAYTENRLASSQYGDAIPAYDSKVVYQKKALLCLTTCALMVGIHKMDAGDDIEDPFSLKDLWQSSTFIVEPLPPLESVHFELATPGLFTLGPGPFLLPRNLIYV